MKFTELASPIIWFVLVVILCVTIITIFSKFAKKSDCPSFVFFFGMSVVLGVFGSMAVFARSSNRERQALIKDQELYNSLVSGIPEGEGWTLNDTMYNNIMKHNHACQEKQDAMTKHPILHWITSGGHIESYEQYCVTIPDGLKQTE